MNIIIDFDDTLANCTEFALQRANIPYDRDNIQWNLEGHSNEDKDLFFQQFEDPAFYQEQVPYPGAVEMVQKLVEEGHRVSIFSAVRPEMMSERAKQIMKYFPMLGNNFTLGMNKNMMAADIILDDAAHNLLESRAKNRVLLRQPWNKNEKGLLSVNNYEEFLALVSQVNGNQEHNKQPPMIAFVGPSGSGKSTIINRLTKMDIRFHLLPAITDRPKRDNDIYGEYTYVDTFDPSVCIEWTEYAGHYYGTREEDVKWIQDHGMIPVRALDIRGALAFKAKYPDAILLFVNRKKDDTIRSLLERNESIDQKVRRICSMDEEYKNESLCDRTIINQGPIDEVVKRIANLF